MNDNNIYNSGLNSEGWRCLRDVISPFIHTEDLRNTKILEVPEHLKNHPLIDNLKKYQESGNDIYLDKAGQYLIPTVEPFGWYTPLTK